MRLTNLRPRRKGNAMGCRFLLMAAPLVFGLALPARAGNLQRIGHTTLVPRHNTLLDTNGVPLPDDKGMYTAFIDPTNGYAYFVGTYLFKLDITGNLPAQVGPALFTGQFSESAVDLAAGYAYMARTSLNRYALGVGTNPVTSAGSITLAAGSAASVVVDDSDPNPSNHYAYVLCTVSGNPAKVAKVALSTLTELGSVTLTNGETNFWVGRVDAHKGYAYFASLPGLAPTIPQVVKIKLTPGTNAPVRIGAVNLDTVGDNVDGGSIDTLHGYAYYGTYDSDTNLPGKVYKVKLEDGDVAPTLVGRVNLHPGEGRLAASVIDPLGGYVYFADDNSYPGRIYQFSLNGTNQPVEIGYLQLQGGTSITTPPNGITTNNWAADGTNLPFGEVFFRSAVVDPVRGFAYLGQDSRPNQVVKIQLERDLAVITSAARLPDGSFQLVYTNTPFGTNTVLTSMDMTVPPTNWTPLGSGVEVLPGQYQFIDPQATNIPQRFYRISSP
jgi:hypothetical protein